MYQTRTLYIWMVLITADITHGVSMLEEGASSTTNADDIAIDLASHTFSSPFLYHSSLPNWYMSGSTIPIRTSRSSVVLNPPIPDRFGFMFNKVSLKSNNFDVSLLMHFCSPPKELMGRDNMPPMDQAMGVWYSLSTDIGRDLESRVKDSASKAKKTTGNNTHNAQFSFSNIIRSSDYDQMTIVPRNFLGVGAVISAVDHKGKKAFSVTLISQDGSTKLESIKSFPTVGSFPLFSAEATNTDVSNLRIRFIVRPKYIALYMQDRMDWRLVGKTDLNERMKGFLEEKRLSTGGYVGITSYTGKMPGSPYGIKVTSVQTSSRDIVAALQGNKEVTKLMNDQGLLSLMQDDQNWNSRGKQIEVLHKLTSVVEKYTMDSILSLSLINRNMYAAQRDSMKLTSAIDLLGAETMSVFRKKTDASGNLPKASAYPLKNLLSEVKSIHDSLKEARSEQNDVVQHAKAKTRYMNTPSFADRQMGNVEKQIKEQNAELNEILESSNRFTILLLLIVVAGAIGMGIFFYMKLNAYAQKASAF